jgi:hypothetical protein
MHLELLHALRPIACAEADGERLLRRSARLLATELGAYCIVDLVEDPPRRIEIAHADLSRTEQLREAVRTVAPLELQRLIEVARRGAPTLSTSKRALAALGLAFVRGGASHCLTLPVMVDGDLHSVLTLVTSRRGFASSEVELLGDAGGWIGLGLTRLARRMQHVSGFPEKTESESDLHTA